MNCDSAPEFFSPLLDAQLPQDETHQLNEHLSSCSKCSDAWARYREVFELVRLVPSCQTDAPAPMPVASRAFFASSRSLSQTRRVVTAAVIAAVGLVVAYGGFKIGGSSNALEPSSSEAFDSGVSETATASMPVMLSKPAGQRLRRAHDGLRNLAWFANEAPSISDPDRAARTLKDVIARSPLESDVRTLRTLDHNSLGTWRGDVHQFCDETMQTVDDVRQVLVQAGQTPETRLLRAREVMLKREAAAQSLLRLSRVARCYDPLPWHSAVELGVVAEHRTPQASVFSEALLKIMSGQARRGATILNQFQMDHPDSPMRPSAQALLQRIQLHWPKQFQVRRVYRKQQAATGVWGLVIEEHHNASGVRVIIKRTQVARPAPSRKL